ncbi:MAG TPA: XRE family transcriptional regulator [Steroidobacteraceae bacterium]|nr:XRE family transcriptional regulator [Steroidobacteraceae bacterium]
MKRNRATKKRISAVVRRCRTGTSVASMLDKEGMLEDAEAVALKRVLAWQLADSMKSQGVTKQELATRMSTSRSHLDRLLDPANASIQLDTVARAARALGKRLEIKLTPHRGTRQALRVR